MYPRKVIVICVITYNTTKGEVIETQVRYTHIVYFMTILLVSIANTQIEIEHTKKK